MSEFVSSEIKAIEKDILSKLLTVCEENNIQCFADGGTLLGAARDGAFIPYDDDIDIAMLRKDFNKLMEIGPTAFSYPYFFQSVFTDKDYFRPHIQIRRSDTCGALQNEIDLVEFNQGIFIDVFPFDGITNKKLNGRIHWLEVKFLKKLMSALYSPMQSDSFLKRAVKAVIKPLKKIFDLKGLYKRFEKVCSRYSDSSDTITLLCFNSFYRQRLLNKSWYDKKVMLKFDEMSLPAPYRYEDVLTSKYGDWKTPVDTNTYHAGVIFDTEHSYEEVRNIRKGNKV